MNEARRSGVLGWVCTCTVPGTVYIWHGDLVIERRLGIVAPRVEVRYSLTLRTPLSNRYSVADPDPGSGAFLTPGSEIGENSDIFPRA